MDFTFEELHHDLIYFFKDDRENVLTVNDFEPEKRAQYELFKKNKIAPLKQWLIDTLNINTDEYKVQFNAGQGNLSWAPWIGINKKGVNSDGPDSYYIALIYSAQNDALLLDITTSGRYMHDDLKLKYDEIAELNQMLKEEICKKENIYDDNMNLVKRRVVPSMNLNSTPNLFLYSAVFYSYIPMDVQNENDIKAYIKRLYEIWIKSNGYVNPHKFFKEHLNQVGKGLSDQYEEVDFTFDEEIHKKQMKGNKKQDPFKLDVFHSIEQNSKLNLDRDHSKGPKFNPTREDADKTREAQTKNGNTGEKLVEQFEKDRLTSLGREDLAQRVHVSINDNDGFDVFSFNDDGTEKRIEVKSNSQNQDNFIISKNELEKALSGYTEIYYVKNPSSSNYKISKVELSEDLSQYVPMSYLVKISK